MDKEEIELELDGLTFKQASKVVIKKVNASFRVIKKNMKGNDGFSEEVHEEQKQKVINSVLDQVKTKLFCNEIMDALTPILKKNGSLSCAVIVGNEKGIDSIHYASDELTDVSETAAKALLKDNIIQHLKQLS